MHKSHGRHCMEWAMVKDVTNKQTICKNRCKNSIFYTHFYCTRHQHHHHHQRLTRKKRQAIKQKWWSATPVDCESIKKKTEQKQNTNIQTNHLFFDHHQCCSNKIYWSKMNETSFMSRHSHCQFRNSASHIACIYIHIESPCFRFLFAKIAALIICCSSAFHFTAAKTFISLTVPHRIDIEYVEVAQLHIKHHISIWYVLMHENNSHFRRHGRMDVYIYMFLLRANTVAM